MEQLPWSVIGSGGGWAAFMVLSFLVLRAMVKGDLIPRSTHERELEAATHDANEWRTEGRIKDQVIQTYLEPIKRASEETGATLHNFVDAAQQVASSARKEGD